MKKLLLSLLSLMLIISLVGCSPKPPKPEYTGVDGLICSGGVYQVRFQEWTFGGCPDDVVQAAGTYWVNKDGRMFFISEITVVDSVDKFGACPESYIREIELDK